MAAFARQLERELAEARKQIDTMLRVDCEQANELLRAMGGDPGYSLLDNAKRLRALTVSARGDIERDAARYRWLQQQRCLQDGTPLSESCYLDLNPRDMDGAIDAALSNSSYVNSKETK
jgi:hypothetical protein